MKEYKIKPPNVDEIKKKHEKAMEQKKKTEMERLQKEFEELIPKINAKIEKACMTSAHMYYTVGMGELLDLVTQYYTDHGYTVEKTSTASYWFQDTVLIHFDK